MKKNRIAAFFHCKECIETKPDGLSPREWVRLEVGLTKAGLQVWCVRHEKSVVCLDFLGQRVVEVQP